MKTNTFVIGLIAASMLGRVEIALAQADDEKVLSVRKATKVMEKCTKIAQEIGQTAVPKDHAKARQAKAHNDKAPAGEQKIAIDEVNAKFAEKMERDAHRLAELGPEYQEAVKAGEAAAKSAGEQHKNDKQTAKAAIDFGAYQKAKEELVAAVVSLTQDPQTTSYVQEVLQTYYLK